MKRSVLLVGLLLATPAYAGRDDFGMGAASVACAMLDLGYSRRSVEEVLNRLERDIINSGISERQQQPQCRGSAELGVQHNNGESHGEELIHIAWAHGGIHGEERKRFN